MTSKRHAMALVLKLIKETSRHDFERHAKVLILIQIEEGSIHRIERACNGARPPN